MSAKRYITLKAGDGGPSQLNYGDVTGDGIEEAMMMLGIESHGSAIPEIVYIFGLSKGKPTLLWSFETGDRADGGLRQVYADHGNLVVELFGKDRVIGRDLYRGDEPLAGPRSFTRARYEWREGEFRMKGSPEVLPNPSDNASPIMPPYFASWTMISVCKRKGHYPRSISKFKEPIKDQSPKAQVPRPKSQTNSFLMSPRRLIRSRTMD